ncbi:MAG: hypothetical protein HFJ67_04635 [Adlercreutzia mucosicola]|nr:hypothetical protein [Adlercreutzia mucosicola]
MPFDANTFFAQTLDLTFEGDEQTFSSAGDFLSEAQRLLDAGEPYPEEYAFLEDFANLDSLPFTEVSQRVEVAGLPLDGLSDVILFLKVLAYYGNVSFKGALYSPQPFDMVDSYVIYFLSIGENEHGKVLDIQQYGRPIGEGPLDIQDEIERWFSGENPRRREIEEENAARRDGNDDEAESSSDNVATLDFPALMLTLLSGNWLFFNEGEIIWNGEHHEIVGIQINAAQVDELMSFWNRYTTDFDDVNEVVEYFLAFMRELEEDEALVVPRDRIAPGICRALPDGPLTGITFANLAACGAAFQVVSVKGDTYSVVFDTRLAIGVPQFFNLVARLLWDWRQILKSVQGEPFKIIFGAARNFDADQYLGGVVEPVHGAQENPMILEVTACPEIVLSEAEAGATELSCEEAAACGETPREEVAAREELRCEEAPRGEAGVHEELPRGDAEREEAERAFQLQVLSDREGLLVGDQKLVFDAISLVGGGVSVDELSSIVEIEGGAKALRKVILPELLEAGLVRAYKESAPGADDNARDKRFYTWSQVRFSLMKKADRKAFGECAKRHLLEVADDPIMSEVSAEVMRLESELSRCSLEKQRLKGELKEAKRAYEEIRHRNKALIKILKRNARSVVG